jgi:hypothetical protein
MNLSEMRHIVRLELHDEDATDYRWSDDELDRCIARAVGEYSLVRPREHRETVNTVAGSREIATGSLEGLVRVEAVEYPIGCFPAEYQPFKNWGMVLTLTGDTVPDGSACCLYCRSLHILDGEGSTIPAVHEDVVATGAAGYAALMLAVHGIDRINTGGADTPGALLSWGTGRLGEFHRALRRLKGIRTSFLVE